MHAWLYYTVINLTRFAKGGLIHGSNFSTLRKHNLACSLPNFVARLYYYYTNMTVNFSLIAELQMTSKLQNRMRI